MSGYNRGDTYEHHIFNLLQERGLIAPNSIRGGAGSKSDIKFLHHLNEHSLEVKLDLKADYGQKMLKWDNYTWDWRVHDSVTDFYTEIGILYRIHQKNITPYRYTVFPKENITVKQKKADQKAFEDSSEIDINALYQFYKRRNCYYIQVGGYGFYHLDRDILQLGTPQFRCKMRLRLRAKTIRSIPVYNYGFYAVLKPSTKPQKSKFDLEELDGRKFPPI